MRSKFKGIYLEILKQGSSASYAWNLFNAIEDILVQKYEVSLNEAKY